MASHREQTNLRAGIVGSGFMGATHARAIRASGGVVVAAVGSTPDRAERAAMQTGAMHGAESVEALLARGDIDVVHVCTPNLLHEQNAVDVLRSGRPVICEKPLATSLAAATRIAGTANEAGLIGSVPFVYRFHPMVRELRARIAGGELGVASVVHGSYLQDWLAGADADNWRVDTAVGGPSRAFADIGSHWFDLFEFVTGDPVVRVSAQVSTVFAGRTGRPEVTTEDAVSVQFTTAAGTLGAVVISQVAAGRKNRLHLEISGTETSFSFDQEEPNRLWLGRSIGDTYLARDPALLQSDAARLSFLPPGHPQGYQDAFNAFIADSYAAFSGPGSTEAAETVPGLEAGVRAAQLCDAVIASARNGGTWITTDPLSTPHRTTF